MEFPYFIIISGPPATGKTTLGMKLKNHYNLPFIYKDFIKESLFDSLGIMDREWSGKLGWSSMVVLYKLTEELLSSKTSLIIESAFFGPKESNTYQQIINKYGAKPIQIHCTGSKDIIMKRFSDRDNGDDRHRGHIRKNVSKVLEDRLDNNTYGQLEINGNTIVLNTNDFSKVSDQDIIEQVNRFIKN